MYQESIKKCGLVWLTALAWCRNILSLTLWWFQPCSCWSHQFRTNWWVSAACFSALAQPQQFLITNWRWLSIVWLQHACNPFRPNTNFVFFDTSRLWRSPGASVNSFFLISYLLVCCSRHDTSNFHHSSGGAVPGNQAPDDALVWFTKLVTVTPSLCSTSS